MTTTTLAVPDRPDRRSSLLGLGVGTSVLALAGALLVPISFGAGAGATGNPFLAGVLGSAGGPSGPAGPVHGGGESSAAEAVLNLQSAEEVAAKSDGCMSCHVYEDTDRTSMHESAAVSIGCTDCHGGDASVLRAQSDAQDSQPFESAKEQAHVQPRADP